MSEGDQKEYFEGKIAEQCQGMRLLSLKITDVTLQLEALRSTQTSLVNAYATQQAELKKTVDLAHKMLGLEGDWICAIDQGVLVQVPGTPENPPEEPASTQDSPAEEAPPEEN